MNVLSNYAFGGDSGSFLLRRSQSLFTENDNSLFHVSLCFDKGVLAVHHSGAGFFPEFFYMFRANFHNFPLSLSDRKIAADSGDGHRISCTSEIGCPSPESAAIFTSLPLRLASRRLLRRRPRVCVRPSR